MVLVLMSITSLFPVTEGLFLFFGLSQRCLYYMVLAVAQATAIFFIMIFTGICTVTRIYRSSAAYSAKK